MSLDPRLLGPCALQPPADLPDVARARHLRRELERAAEHGVALLAALGLPRVVDADFVQGDHAAIGEALDLVVSHLDAIDDPDEDLEEDTDLEKGGDDELDLGWSALHSQIRLGVNTDDGDHTAPERHGCGFVRCAPDDFEISEADAHV